MAQTRYFNWKDDDRTDWLNRRILGVVPYGVYRGFDFNGGTNSFDLEHSSTGFDEVTKALALRADLGLLITKQGVVVIEDAPITLLFTPETTGQPRIDLVIVEHEYLEVNGGNPAIYQVLLGTASSTPAPPTLTTPNKQLIIGELHVPANASNSSQCTWIKQPNPMFMYDPTIVKTNINQIITSDKEFQFNTYKEGYSYTYDLGTKTITFHENRNLYVVQSVSGVISNIDFDAGLQNKKGRVFTILFENDCVIDYTSGSNIEELGAELPSTIEVKGGDCLTFWEVDGTGIFTIVQSQYVRNYAYNAFKKAISTALSTRTATSSAQVHLALNKEANSFVIDTSISSYNYGIKSLQSIKEGTVLMLTVEGLGLVTVFHNYNNIGDPIPAGYKPIYCPRGYDPANSNPRANLQMYRWDYALLIERSTYYEVMFYHSYTESDLITKGKVGVLENRAKVENWRYIGSGASMDNGQPVPSSTLTTPTNYRPQRLRKNYLTNVVEMQGVVNLAGSTAGGTVHTLYQLPTGYFNNSTSLDYTAIGLFDDGSIIRHAPVTVNISRLDGTVSIYIPENITFGGDVMVEYHISHNLD